MKAAIFINTPAQFHFWRPIGQELERRGHSAYFLLRQHAELATLAQETGQACWVYSSPPATKIGKIASFPRDVLKAWRYLRKEKPDVVAGFGLYEAFVGRLLRKPAVSFTDDEPSLNSRGYQQIYRAYMPLVSAIITPEWFRDDLGRRHIRVKSLKEVAYLNPKRRSPTDQPPLSLGVSVGQRYALIRVNAFQAVHDVGMRGFEPQLLVNLVNSLSEHGKVFVSFEGSPIEAIKDHGLPTKKSEIHSVLEHAALLVTDTQTMATESVLLGTPTIRCNGFVGPNDMGVFQYLAQCGALQNHTDSKVAVKAAVRLFAAQTAKEEARRQALHIWQELDDVVPIVVNELERVAGARPSTRES
jgi:uncharacterized protein